MIDKISEIWCKTRDHRSFIDIWTILMVTNHIYQLALSKIKNNKTGSCANFTDLKQISSDRLSKLNRLLFDKLINLIINISKLSSSFKILSINGLQNQIFNLFFYRFGISFEKRDNKFIVIRSWQIWFCTPSLAQLKIIVTTKFFLIELSERTSPILNNLPEILEKFFEFFGIMLRSNISCTIIELFSRNKDLRHRMASKFDIRIGVCSFEHIIERREMLLDKIRLQIETFGFIFYNDKINMICLCKHILLSHRSWSEILRNSLVKIFCFPDVENFIFGSFEKINSRFLRDMRDIKRFKHRCE